MLTKRILAGFGRLEKLTPIPELTLRGSSTMTHTNVLLLRSMRPIYALNMNSKKIPQVMVQLYHYHAYFTLWHQRDPSDLDQGDNIY